METKIVQLQKLDQDEIDAAYELAGQIIRDGGLVAFPTETVYGLGANALDAEAAARIYAAKGRPSDNPLIAHIADQEQVLDLADYIPESAKIMMRTFWPGPLTIIFKKKKTVPDGTTGGLDTVAVRMPDHPVAQRLIRAAGVPIAAPSANISGRPSPTTARRTVEDMAGKIEMILDGGSCRIGIESTIVDVTEEVPVILRPGYITCEELQELLGSVEKDKALDQEPGQDFHPRAPGQKYRHYAPNASMTLVEGGRTAVSDRICSLAEAAFQEGKIVGILCTDETKQCYEDRCPGGIVKSLGSREDLDSVACNLYETLRSFDEAGADVIYSEGFPPDSFGWAVMNRMVKAAGHHIIKV